MLGTSAVFSCSKAIWNRESMLPIAIDAPLETSCLVGLARAFHPWVRGWR
jgi:hypothetical protein